MPPLKTDVWTCLLVLGTPVNWARDPVVFLLDEIFKGGSCLKVLGMEQHHLIVCQLVHVPRVSLLDLFVKDFKIARTSSSTGAHGPEPLVAEMDLDLFGAFDVGNDVVVECTGR